MIKRICPSCKRAVHSADAVNDWTCPECEATVPVGSKAEEVPAEERICYHYNN